MTRGWRVLALTSIGVFLVSLDVSILNVAFRDLLGHFGEKHEATLPWVFSAYNVTFAAALLTAGRAADRFGRKRAFLFGVGIFAIGSVCGAAASSVTMLIAARVIQAVGGALIMPASLGLVLPEFPVERRSAAIGVWGAIGGVAVATGPSVGGILVDQAGWRSIFLFNLPLCALAIVLGGRMLRESREADARGMPDILGAAVAATAIGLMTLAVIEANRWGPMSFRFVGALLAAFALLGLFMRRCAHHPRPVIEIELFRRRYFTTANAAMLLFAASFAAGFFANTQLIQGTWGYSVLAAGMAMTPGPLLAASSSAPAGRLAQRIGHRNVVIPGISLFCLGTIVLLWRAGPEPNYLGAYLPAMVLMGIGIGMTISTLSSAANAYLPPHQFSVGSAVNTTARQIGAALGIAAVTALRQDAPPMLGYRRAWVFMVVCAASAGALIAVFYRRPTLSQLAESDTTGRASSEIEPVGSAIANGVDGPST